MISSSSAHPPFWKTICHIFLSLVLYSVHLLMLLTVSCRLALDVEISTMSFAYMFLLLCVVWLLWLCIAILNKSELMESPCKTPFVSILKKYHVFAPMGRFQLESIYLYFPPSSQLVYLCFCPKGLQDRNINMLLIVHQCFLMTLSRKIVVLQALQATNKFYQQKCNIYF